MSDPTKVQMYRELISTFKRMLKGEGKSEWKFDIESAIYWFASDYHDGQWSNLYSVLSTSDYRPGPMETGLDSDENFGAKMMYEHLVSKFV